MELNRVIFEQNSYIILAPLLTNIIMTDLKEKVIKPLIKDNTRYLDDTLFAIKCEDVSRIKNLLNNFDPSLRFTEDLFQNDVPYFLNLTLSPDGASVF